ncbi:MAG: Stealth CR1 domain-containing protein, partial [Candidatus Binatia bacterium]
MSRLTGDDAESVDAVYTWVDGSSPRFVRA